MKGFDLAALDTKSGAEEGFEFELTHPATGAGIGVFWTVIGADSEDYRRKQMDFARKRTNQFMKNRKFTVSPEQAEEEAIELVVLATKGWRTKVEEDKSDPVVVIGKETYPFSADNVRKVCQRFPVIREQVAEQISERENFLPKSAKG